MGKEEKIERWDKRQRIVVVSREVVEEFRSGEDTMDVVRVSREVVTRTEKGRGGGCKEEGSDSGRSGR